jgi:hypothetical protein
VDGPSLGSIIGSSQAAELELSATEEKKYRLVLVCTRGISYI